MALGTAASFGAWIFVMSAAVPEEATAIDFVLFYLTMTVTLIGALALVGILYRVYVLKRQDVISREVLTSFRHAVLLSIVAAIALALSSQAKFHWWSLFVLIAIACVIEYVFLMTHRNRHG